MENHRIFIFSAAAVLIACLLASPASASNSEEGRPGRARGEEKNMEARRGEAMEAAGRRMHDIEYGRARIRERLKEEAEAARELARRHRKAITEAEKEALEAELRSTLEDGFERRHSALMDRLEELRDECAAIESRIRKNIERKDEIIEMRLERLLAPPFQRGRSPAGERNESPQE